MKICKHEDIRFQSVGKIDPSFFWCVECDTEWHGGNWGFQKVVDIIKGNTEKLAREEIFKALSTQTLELMGDLPLSFAIKQHDENIRADEREKCEKEIEKAIEDLKVIRE